MHLSKVKDFLDTYGVKYVVISHSKAYTAQGIAAVSHISGKELAKTVIVKLDGALAMAVLPASYQVDLMALKKATGVREAEMASERESNSISLTARLGPCLHSAICMASRCTWTKLWP